MSQQVMSGPEPPLAQGAPMATGLTVLEHLSRNQVMDVYDVWDERRYCRCVAKVLHPDFTGSEHDQERLRREGELLRGFTHPHIVRAYETLDTPSPIVLLETLSGETLSHLFAHRSRRMPTSELAIMGLQVGSATRYLHAEGWLHLDLKPSNVIIDGGLAKVIDLSLVRPPGRNRAGIGTRPYLSPEQARGAELTTAADVWGLGTLLFETACGHPPFESSAEPVYPQLHQPAPSVHAERRLPKGLGDLIDACLKTEPGARPPVDAVLDILERFA